MIDSVNVYWICEDVRTLNLVVVIGDFGSFRDFVYQPVLDGRVGIQKEISIAILGDLLY